MSQAWNVGSRSQNKWIYAKLLVSLTKADLIVNVDSVGPTSNAIAKLAGWRSGGQVSVCRCEKGFVVMQPNRWEKTPQDVLLFVIGQRGRRLLSSECRCKAVGDLAQSVRPLKCTSLISIQFSSPTDSCSVFSIGGRSNLVLVLTLAGIQKRS